MATTERYVTDTSGSRKIVIVVAIVAAVVLALAFYLLMRASSSGGSTTVTRLEGAIRPGSSEWEIQNKIFREEPVADEAKRALGDIVMTLHTKLRNFTGKTLTGLEMRAAVVDHQGKAVKERTVVIIPARQAELGPNKDLDVNIVLDGMSDTDDRANIRMEITGFKVR